MCLSTWVWFVGQTGFAQGKIIIVVIIILIIKIKRIKINFFKKGKFSKFDRWNFKNVYKDFQVHSVQAH